MNATELETPPTPASETSGAGGGQSAPAARAGRFARIAESAWMPVAAKAAAILAGMIALAGIGAASIANGNGVPVAAAAAGSADPVWTAPVRSAPHEAPRTAPSASSALSPPSAGTAPPAPSATAAPAPASAGLTPDGKVILNTAGVDDLRKLPRVGAKRAEAIVALRSRLGRFRHPSDLLRVKGIGRTTLKNMLPLMVLDPPPAAPVEAAPRLPRP